MLKTLINSYNMKIVYKSLLVLIIFGFSVEVFAQKTATETPSLLEKKIFRLNVLSPGVGLELRTGKFSSLSFSTGVTYNGSVNGMNVRRKSGPTGWNYSFEPFLNIEQKFFYNLQKRSNQGKNTSFNSGNFIALRSLTLGKPIEGNLIRQSDIDFMFLASWGFQRSYNRIHFLFDTGPLFVFDAKGNSGFFPIFFRINLGYNF